MSNNQAPAPAPRRNRKGTDATTPSSSRPTSQVGSSNNVSPAVSNTEIPNVPENLTFGSDPRLHRNGSQPTKSQAPMPVHKSKQTAAAATATATPELQSENSENFYIPPKPRAEEQQHQFNSWEDCFYGPISREEAEMLLFSNRADYGRGTFLIREKRVAIVQRRHEVHSDYIFSFVSQTKPFDVKHYKVTYNPQDNTYSAVGNERVAFHNMDEVIKFYSNDIKLLKIPLLLSYVNELSGSRDGLSIFDDDLFMGLGYANTTSKQKTLRKIQSVATQKNLGTSSSSRGNLHDIIQDGVVPINQRDIDRAYLTNLRETRTIVKRFAGPDHYHPDTMTKYFHQDKIAAPWDQWKVCTVIFPFFNEDERELRRSLVSIYKQAKGLFKYKTRVHILCVMDGWFKASDSMKKYVKQMFPHTIGAPEEENCCVNVDCPRHEYHKKNIDIPWWEKVENSPDTVDTFVLQRVSAQYNNEDSQNKAKEECVEDPTYAYGERSFIDLVDIDENVSLKVSMVVKKDNRRKHNSHMWFFNAFCQAYQPDYCFATDCGTLYEKHCLRYLVEHLENNSKFSGCTGRQRVMTRAMQGCEGESLIGRFYRAAQSYDYEASISSTLGGFAFNGFLPVLPGPCGLYRYNDIKGAPLDYYFDTVNDDPDTAGIIKGNLLLAEDRVLSLAAVLKTPEPKETTWVPHATFYFEAETETEKFISQRRRWTNGSFAGYIYLTIQKPSLIWSSPHSLWFRMMAMFLMYLQLMIYCLVIISPGIFGSIFYFALNQIYERVWPENWNITIGSYVIGLNGDQYTTIFVYAIYALVYLLYVLIHMKKKYSSFIYNCALVLNALGMILLFGAMIATIVWNVKDYGVSSLGQVDQSLMILIAFAVFFLPFILALMSSLTSFYNMLCTFPAYLLFLPTFTGWFGAYAFVRTSDLTWGNRPSDSLFDHTNDSNQASNAYSIKAAPACVYGLDAKQKQMDSDLVMSRKIKIPGMLSQLGSDDDMMNIASKTNSQNSLLMVEGDMADPHGSTTSLKSKKMGIAISTAHKTAPVAAKKPKNPKKKVSKSKLMRMGYFNAFVSITLNLTLATLFFFFLDAKGIFVVTIFLLSFTLVSIIMSLLFYFIYTPYHVSKLLFRFCKRSICCVKRKDRGEVPDDMV